MYRITYENGITQEKELISHFEYKTRIVPDNYIMATLGALKLGRKKMDKIKKKVKAIKAGLSADYPNEWFTDQSPLFEAITTGVVDLSDHMGEKYKYNCTIEKIDD